MTTKVLSIDLDYIMGPTIETYQHETQYDNPEFSWDLFYIEHPEQKKAYHWIDQSNLLYCHDIFLKSLKYNPDVSFGYDHDAILYAIHQCSDIELINVDHHDDVMHGANFNGNYDLNLEYFHIVNSDSVCEGNWGAWLHHKGRLKSFTWIHNKNSANLQRNDFNEDLLGDKYHSCSRNEYEFENYKFDYVYVCLSPLYIPPQQWHYFTMFMMTYKEFTGNDINLLSQQRFEYNEVYNKVTDAILH